jgi:hypothetical protein
MEGVKKVKTRRGFDDFKTGIVKMRGAAQLNSGKNVPELSKSFDIAEISGKSNKVKIYVNGFEEKTFDMVDSAPQPKGFIYRVSLVMEKGKISRVYLKYPK